MKIYNPEEVLGGVILILVVFIKAIFDYINSSTLQAVVNAIASVIAIYLFRKITKMIRLKFLRYKQNKQKEKDNHE